MSTITLSRDKEKIEGLSKALNQQIANFNVLYMKLHHYHWFIKGTHFFALHEKFEELYNEITLHMDEIAERLLSIGGQPISTLKQCLNDASIQEAAGNEDEQQMVSTLTNDLHAISGELKTGMDSADSCGDEGTADMLLAIKSSFEKHIWMLNSYLKK